jgi:predicted Ser/Thr protein kinase
MKTCKQCGQPMASDAPEGLCARCLLSAAVKGSDTGASALVQPAAPPIAEIAAHFPQLEILELLGRGGMGMVYKARQPALDRVVALKILPQETSSDAQFAERFTREARALARLNHPNIVGVYEFGERDGLFFFIMEFVDGPNLRQLIQTRAIKPAEALAIVPKICEALQFAHEEGVMHRDIKPENVLIDKRGRVKIADFGLAKILGIETGDLALTQKGMSLGTPRYMAPEQIEHPEDVDHRADIYSLGVVFYEMLTGELPIGRFAPPSQKVEVDVRLDDVVLRSLEKDVLRRYQHASELKSDMDTIASQPAIAGAGAPPLPPAATAIATPARLSRTALWGAIWTAVGMIAAILLGLGFLAVQVDYGGVVEETGSVPARTETVVTAPTGRMSFIGLIVMLPLVVAAASAPFGTTICGAVALAQIKRSEGKLYGLRLAAADLLFYPTLAVLWLLALGAVGLMKLRATRFGPGEIAILGVGVLVALIFAFRGAWRAAVGKVGASNDSAVAASDSGFPSGAPALLAVRNPAIGLFVTGIFYWVMIPLCFFLLMHGQWQPRLATNFLLSFGIVPLVVGTLMILGGVRMNRLENRGLAMAASMLPLGVLGFRLLGMAAAGTVAIGPADIIGAPMGLWALAVLMRHEVKVAFAARARRDAVPPLPGLPWSAAVIPLIAGIALTVAAAIVTESRQPLFSTFHGVTDFAKGPDGPVLSDAFIKRSGFPPPQIAELNRIIGTYYREFVSLERRHTDVSKDVRGHVRVEISPFPDECLDLGKRMTAELRGVLGRNLMPRGPRDAQELKGIGLFRHCGAAQVSVKLWKEGADYWFEEQHGMHSIPGGRARSATRSGKGKNWRAVFPEEYHVYWTELEN